MYIIFFKENYISIRKPNKINCHLFESLFDLKRENLSLNCITIFEEFF